MMIWRAFWNLREKWGAAQRAWAVRKEVALLLAELCQDAEIASSVLPAG